jgi:hypothetical protein
MKDVRMSKQRVPESAGNYYIFYTTVLAPSDGTFDLLSGETKPYLLFVNRSKTDINNNTIKLKKGANRILVVYNKACETYLVFRKPDTPRPVKQPISMCWYRDYGVLPFDCYSNNNSSGLFAFESAPGLQSFTFAAYGKVTVMVDGFQIEPSTLEKQADKLTDYRVNINKAKQTTSQVVIKIEYLPGYRGAGAIPQYLKQNCGKGSITLGDWSEIDGLRAYSGGAWYRKTISINDADIKNKLEIDLGNLVSSAELFVNGRSAGIRLSPPYTFDITEFAVKGENKIEVLVYNTAANNYTSIPTRYRGNIRSGLSGPVVLKYLDNILK